MKVKIINTKGKSVKECWYLNRLGETFEVVEDSEGDFDVTDENLIAEVSQEIDEVLCGIYISKEDAEIILDEVG